MSYNKTFSLGTEMVNLKYERRYLVEADPVGHEKKIQKLDARILKLKQQMQKFHEGRTNS